MMIVLFLLQIKHWYVDFVMQTDSMVAGKAIYGNKMGMLHSMEHAIATLLILLFFVDPITAIALALFDFVTHYHIDWVKMNYGCKDIQNPKFWSHLGLDQMAHQIVYLIIAFAIML